MLATVRPIASATFRALTALAGLLIVAGCTGNAPVASPSPTVPTSTAPSVTASPTPPTITLAFGGDVHFMKRTDALLKNPATALGPAASILNAADLAMVNLETPVTQRGTAADKEYTFRARPAAFDAIKAAGIDVVTVANNHGMDYGQVGLADTLKYAADAGMPLVGAGSDASSAYAPYVTTIQGVRIAIVGLTEVDTYTSTWSATKTRPGLAYARTSDQLATAVAAIRAARAQADVVVVFVHWGEERSTCPTDLQRRTAKEFADAGATLIIGAHPHILEGAGWLGGTYVAYSIGNFLWYSDTSNPDTGVLRVTLTGASVTGAELVPAIVSRSTGQSIPSTGAEATRILDKFDDLRACTGLAATRS
jgi:poly-gamma-glutamate synthesis protein (capsule biosynthesis protein)